MKKTIRLFMDIQKEQDWLAQQTGWKLVKTNGFNYIFEESDREYHYEYIFFDKSKKELEGIRAQITDPDVEFVCNSSSWALFRKDVAKGAMSIYADTYLKYKILMKKNKSYVALGVCYMILGLSQVSVASIGNSGFRLSAILFYLCSAIFYACAFSLKRYAVAYDDGTYADRMKNDK